MKALLFFCLLIFSVQVFAHCGACGSGDESHDDHTHQEGESSNHAMESDDVEDAGSPEMEYESEEESEVSEDDDE